MPMPRMTNTFMLSGESDPQEVIASVDSGLYAVSFGGGQVDITNGKFVFSASEAYLIEDGKLTRPVKGASLIGNGPDVLTRITMVGNDLALDTGVGPGRCAAAGGGRGWSHSDGRDSVVDHSGDGERSSCLGASDDAPPDMSQARARRIVVRTPCLRDRQLQQFAPRAAP